MQAAVAAFRGTSFSSDKRGESIRLEYAGRLNEAHAEVMAKARTPEQQAAGLEALQEMKRRYRSAFMEYLGRRAGTTSWMITGRSGRNERRERKKMDAASKRAHTADEIFDRGLARAHGAVAQQKVTDAGGPLQVAKNRLANAERFQAAMKAANRIIRKKKLSDEEKVQGMIEIGLSAAAARKALTPDFAGRLGFPSYALTNNNALIKRLRDKIAKMEAQAARIEAIEAGGAPALADIPFPAGDGFPAGSVEFNEADERLRLHFDAKPSADMIAKLKGRGFRWSRKNEAWQRKLTANARQAAGEVLFNDWRRFRQG